MNRSFIALIFSLFVIQSCAYHDSGAQNTNTQNMRWLYAANPARDVERAVARGDFRFRSVNGVGLSVPGIFIQCIDRETQIRPIRGTSDVNETREHEKLNKLAIKYAKSFNTKMLKHLTENQGFSCNENA